MIDPVAESITDTINECADMVELAYMPSCREVGEGLSEVGVIAQLPILVSNLRGVERI